MAAKYRIHVDILDEYQNWIPVWLAGGPYQTYMLTVDAIDPACALQAVADSLHAAMEDDGTGR